MVISKNSQLGLRFEDKATKVDYLRASSAALQGKIDILLEQVEFLQSAKINNNDSELSEEQLKEIWEKYNQDYFVEAQDNQKSKRISEELHAKYNSQITNPNESSVLLSMLDTRKDSKYFYICDSVYEASELVKIGGNFTSRTFKDVELGQYTYLLGKHRMIRFTVAIGVIIGFYYDEKNKITFEFGLNIENGEHYTSIFYQQEFSMVMQLMAFIELGDTEVIELKGGRNNGKPKNDGKITNTHNYTVYVVDSSWNKLIIRTEGFAVKGHFRFQPCGPGMADRRLQWITAFEKFGYIRRPRAEILRD